MNKARTIVSHWRWGLLTAPLLAIAAVVLIFASGDLSPRPVDAGGPDINIEKRDRDTNALLPGACFEILSATQVLEISVCDNQEFVDLDPTDGLLQVPGNAGIHNVVETLAPVGYTLKPGKTVCDNSISSCLVVLLNDAVVVGGVAELPDGDGVAPLQTSGSSGLDAGLLAGIAAAAAVALGGAAWFARKRLTS